MKQHINVLLLKFDPDKQKEKVMKRHILLLVCCALLIGVVVQADDHAYAGLKKCKMCHKGDSKGNIYETWEVSSHAKAYATLGEEAAKEVYAKLGKTGNPQEDPECLNCHVTGYGEDASLTEKVVKEEGVMCESCHQAGGDYWKKAVMSDREQALANGLNPDPKSACVKCHNEKSPEYKEFNFEERWAKIKHSRPE